ncbi:MAG: hypothetical protein IH892_18820 [Planctomycetes bacterium]|nr:hypothetical protein [Planctomycetota bacterium]
MAAPQNAGLPAMAVVHIAGSICVAAGAGLDYPETERMDHTDEYHGVKVADPYRWLEEDVRQSPRVRDWVTAQNKVTFDYLAKLPRREQIEKRLTALWDYEKHGMPSKVGGRYVMSKNDGLQNHSVIYVAESLEGPRRVLFNPNEWSEDGTVSLGGLSFSHDGALVAYAVQDAGSDWRTWKVRNVATGKDLGDSLSYLKFTGVAWDPAAQGFFYAKYPDPDPDSEFQSLNTEMKVMYHRLGTEQAEDVVVYYRPDHPEWGYEVHVRIGDGYLGWPEAAPFDAIIVTAAAPRVPEPLVEQLAVGGWLVIPLGETFQHLYAFHKTEGGLVQEGITPVRFVPMVGQIRGPAAVEP